MRMVVKVISSSKPLIVHVIHRLHTGGLENGLVNLINTMSEDEFDHAIVCMTDYTNFARRIKKDNVAIYAMNKKQGKDYLVYYRLWRLFRELRPTIVHTRNIATLEAQFAALLAGVKIRIHGEHGRTMDDLDGKNKKYVFLRRLLSPIVTRYIALSDDIANWLRLTVGVSQERISHIYNGVDVGRFHSAQGGSQRNKVVFATVGRLQQEKDQITLLKAFGLLMKKLPTKEIELVIVGEGPLRIELQKIIDRESLADAVRLLGDRDDVPDLMRSFDVFVLPSLAEGISNTILEAMATGLPVLATRVGGNPELVVAGETGDLVEPAEPEQMAGKMMQYIKDRHLIRQHGEAARTRVNAMFSLEKMTANYTELYKNALG